MAREKALVGPVKSSTPLRAGGFRAKRAVAIDRAQTRLLQPVKASVERRERFRSQLVKHSQTSTRH